MPSSTLSPSGHAGETRPQRTALIVDVDHVTARATLFSRVEGQTRFVSGATVPSTALPPIDDVSVGAKQAIRAVEEHFGSYIFGQDGIETPRSGDHGVDVVAMTGMPVAPVRLQVLVLGSSPLTAALIAAARRTPTIVDVIEDRARTIDGVFSGSLLEGEIRAFGPDVLAVVQGDTAGNEWQSTVGTLNGLVHDEVVSLVIIVAGDQYQQQAAHALGDSADLRGIDPAEFSTLDIASALEAELQLLYDQRINTHSIAAAAEDTRFTSRIRAGDLVTRFLSRRMNGTVAYVDSADGTTIHWSTPTIGDVVSRPDVDVTRHIRAILSGDLNAVTHWLPFSITTEDLSHWVLNRALRPNTVADATHDMAIERAVLVELVRSIWESMSASRDSAIDMIVAGRPFSTMREPALAALALLDIFQPTPANGIVEMVLDTDGLVPAAGAIGEVNPAMAADVVENDLLLRFATGVIVTGTGAEGELAVRGQVRSADGDVVRFTVPYGSVHLLRLNPQQETTITLVCESGYTIGGNREYPEIVVGGDDNPDAGDFGMIIDARGRPLKPGTEPTLRASRVTNWLEDLGLNI